MNRIERTTQAAKKKKQKLFCAYVTLGYPTVPASVELIEASCREGVDLIEWGFPFSDPLADGPVIQQASEKALGQGVTIRQAFDGARRLRQKGVETPFIFFTYFNPVLHYGVERFAREAGAAGFDGVIIPDLPPDEEPRVQRVMKTSGLQSIFLIAPTTSDERARLISRASEGFIYYVSLKGVTGAQSALPADIRAHLKKLKKMTAKPILIGFGVSKEEQAKTFASFSDGVIVGSAIVQKMGQSKAAALQLVRGLLKAVRSQ